jgi:hypothetical protein
MAWLNELYSVAWTGQCPLLTAPCYKLHVDEKDPTLAIRIECFTVDERIALRGWQDLPRSEVVQVILNEMAHPIGVGPEWFPHEFFSLLCDGAFDVFQASAWALAALRQRTEVEEALRQTLRAG